MNDLITIENNELKLLDEGIKEIKKFQKAKIQLNLMEEKIKKMFLDLMEQTGTTRFTSPDGTFKVTYIAETISSTFDSKKLKEENPDLYEKYKKETTRKAYVKLS